MNINAVDKQKGEETLARLQSLLPLAALALLDLDADDLTLGSGPLPELFLLGSGHGRPRLLEFLEGHVVAGRLLDVCHGLHLILPISWMIKKKGSKGSEGLLLRSLNPPLSYPLASRFSHHRLLHPNGELVQILCEGPLRGKPHMHQRGFLFKQTGRSSTS